jgi:hypothetical protein
VLRVPGVPGWKAGLNTVSTDLRALLLELGRRRRQLWLTPATEAS